ncbi:MAG: hypothetical protein JW807_08555 [Spirochaetes bacterium]|nr:hypothetical protein [Spirochaetota bacterium]
MIDVPVTADADVEFNTAMDPLTITVQATDGPCTGSVQISMNDFASCLGAVVSSSDNITFTINPANNLFSCESYRVRITTEARSADNVPLIQVFTQPNGFSTQGDAVWTEDAGNPIYGGSLDGTDRAYYPFALKVGDIYHLWYGDGSNTRHSTSYYQDFNDVSFPPAVVTGLIATGPYHPRVLYNASGWDIGTPSTHYDGPFLMYYTDGANWTSAPRVAHSVDGSSWTDIGACNGINLYPLPPNNNSTVYNLAVLYEGGATWKGYADNGSGMIQYYASSNGIDWTGVAYNIVAPSQAWETDGINPIQGTIAPFIMKNGGTYVLFYSSGIYRNDNAFGFATSSDGQSFTKSPSNPIFSINDGVAWRANRTYTSSIVQNGAGWLLYFSGRSSAGVYSVGLARKCGALY